MAEKLPGRPCADIKNMYHSLVRSGKIERNEKPRRAQQQQQSTKTTNSAATATKTTNKRKKNTEKAGAESKEQPKKKFRKSGIPLLVAAPAPFCSPNTTNAARVLMSLDACTNSAWPVEPDTTTELISASTSTGTTETETITTTFANDSKPQLLLLDKPPALESTTALSSSCWVDEPTENVFCRVHLSSNNTPKQEFLGCATLPCTHLTFAQARGILQSELLDTTTTISAEWQFCVPGQGLLSRDQECHLSLNFLVTPETVGTVSAPLQVVVVETTAETEHDEDPTTVPELTEV